MDRRTAIRAAGLLPAAFLVSPRAQEGLTRTDFTNATPDTVLAFQLAVRAMKNRLPNDPTSWDALAALHNFHDFRSKLHAISIASELPPEFDGAAEHVRQVAYQIDFDKLGATSQGIRGAWGRCLHHGSMGEAPFRLGYFLGWHRQYLMVFEDVLVDAMKTAAAQHGLKPVYGLPYWNYYSSRTIPEPFRRVLLADGSENPLYVSYRNTARNRRNDPQEMGLQSYLAFSLKDLRTEKSEVTVALDEMGNTRPAEGFDEALEVLPHDQVHGEIGGLMSDVNTAAWDPIFWLHHANIDRLWAGWLGNMAVKPSDMSADWRAQKFQYPTANGMREMLIGDVVSTAGYGYDNITLPSQAGAGPSLPVPKPLIVATQPAKPSATTSSANSQSVAPPVRASFTGAGGTVRLSLPQGDSKTKFLALGSGVQMPNGFTTATLVIEGVRPTREGMREGFVYDVVISRSGDAASATVGRINVFNLRCLGPNCGKPKPPSFRFPIVEALKRLSVNSSSALSGLDVSLVPTATPAGEDDQDRPILIRADSIRIEASTLPLR